MRRILYLLAVLILCHFETPTHAEVLLYETDKLKIGVSEVSAVVLYDFDEREALPGVKTSITQWGKLNLDLGIIGKEEFDLGSFDAFLGLSYDLRAFEWEGNIYSSIGFFASPGWLDEAKERYGVYFGLAVKF